MREQSFADLMRDPTDWFEEIARLARLHHEKLAGQGGDTPVTQEAACVSPPCAVIVLDSRRRP